MRRVVVVGGAGQLGAQICRAFESDGWEVVAPGHELLDVVDPVRTSKFLSAVRPELLINTSAVHDLGVCESDPDLAWGVNVGGVENLARASAEVSAYMIHFSTDYVFDGLKDVPYVESDVARPVNQYGVTKLAGEHRLLQSGASGAVVRVSAIYGADRCRGKSGFSFVERMLRRAVDVGELRVVDDERVGPTSTASIANQLLVMAETQPTGLFHATSQGDCSWYEFTLEFLRLAGVNVDVQAVSASAFPSAIKRPPYSVLENAGLQNLGIDCMPTWQDALIDYMDARTPPLS